MIPTSNRFPTVTLPPQRLAKDGGEQGKSCCNFLGNSFKITLIVIGSLGAAGIMSGVSVGGIAIGLAAPLAIASCFTGSSYEGKQRNSEILIDTIYALVAAILGSLTIVGILPATSMGWSLLMPILAFIALEIIRTFHAGIKARQAESA